MASQRSGRLSASWRAYRIADRRHNILDGQGAAMFGGRWNSPGRRVIYAAETFAGAMLEVLVNAKIGRMPTQYAWIEILIGDDVSKKWMRERFAVGTRRISMKLRATRPKPVI
jgi:RES domain-containing protein